jgi:hypothetical protein
MAEVCQDVVGSPIALYPEEQHRVTGVFPVEIARLRTFANRSVV